MASERKRGRARRALGAIGTLVIFVGALAASAIVHLDVSATRRLVATQVTRALHGVFAGSLDVEQIDRLGVRGASGVRVRVRDREGVQVIAARGVRARIDTVRLVRSLFASGPLEIALDAVGIDDAEVTLDGDAAGSLRLANAFGPKSPKAPSPPPSSPGPGVRLTIPTIAVRHAWVHGAPGAAPPADADLSELRASLVVEPKGDTTTVQVDASHVGIVARALPPRSATLRADATVRFALPSSSGEGVLVEATLGGDVSGAPLTAWALLDDKRLDARLDLSDLTRAKLAAIATELPLDDAATLHAEAHGTLPHLDATAEAKLGRATASVDGAIDLGAVTRVRADLRARHVDLARVLGSAPASDLGLDAHAAASFGPDGDLRADLAADTLPGTLDRTRVPRVTLRAFATKDTAFGAARVHDADAPTDVAVALTGTILDAQVRSRVPDLRRVPVIGSVAAGSVELRADARLDLGSKALSAQADLSGAGLARGADAIDGLRALARVSGTLDRPVIDARLHASGVRVAGQEATGVDAHARVTAGKPLIIEDARAEIARKGIVVSAGAGRITLGGGRLAIEDGRIEGLGDPIRLDLSRDARALVAKVDAPGIDLGKVGAALDRATVLQGGKATLRGDVTLSDHDTIGQLHAGVSGLTTSQVRKAGNARLDARIVDRAVEIDLDAAFGDAGRITIETTNVRLAGSALDARAWKDATGRVALGGEVDLARASWLVTEAKRPLGDLRGRLAVVGGFDRDAANAAPTIHLSAYTLGLVVAGKRPPEPPHGEARVHPVPPWRSDDVDLGLDVALDGASHEAELALRAVDAHGAVAAFDAKAHLPYDALVHDPSSARALLERTTFQAKLSVPRRSLAKMPSILGIHDVAGSVDAELDVSGTAYEPAIELVSHLHEMRSVGLAANATDGDVHFTYDGKVADLRVTAANGGRRTLALGAKIDIASKELLEGARAPAWGGELHATLTDFPLESVDAVASRRVRGHVSGDVALDGLHRDARLHVELATRDLSIKKTKYTSGRVVVDARAGGLAAKARLEQTDGFLEASARSGLEWGAALVPALDRGKALEAKLDAKAFRAAALAPFVQGVLDELDGRLDAAATLALGPRAEDTKMAGTIAFRDGKVQIAAIGEELHDARFTVTLSPDGTIKVADLAAKGVEGELSGDATIALRGFALASAEAHLHVPEKKPLDLALVGQPIGRVSADVTLKATANADASKVTIAIAIPTSRIDLPQTTKSNIQRLEEQPATVRVGVFRGKKDFVKLPLDKDDLTGETPATSGRVTDIDIDIGEATILRGQMARVVVGGHPHVVLGDKARMTGRITVKEGTIDLQGKKFEIEKGTITFQPEDTSNPVVVATAFWTAEDGTKVYADFVGPVKTGKVELRSEPPLPKSEILALVLFGTASGANATPAPAGRAPDGTTRAATAIGGGFATQGLTEALDDLTGLQATARIDTTNANNPRPEVELQIARDVSVMFAHVLGNPPISEPDTNYATLDWRFRHNWSLETTVGDRGSSMVDAVWRRSY